MDKVNLKHYSTQTETGNNSTQIANRPHISLVATGDYCKQVVTRDNDSMETTGRHCIMAGVGNWAIARGKKGSWIVLAEWVYSIGVRDMIPECVKAVQIDGKIIKEDTWYWLFGGKLVELDENPTAYRAYRRIEDETR